MLHRAFSLIPLSGARLHTAEQEDTPCGGDAGHLLKTPSLHTKCAASTPQGTVPTQCVVMGWAQT